MGKSERPSNFRPMRSEDFPFHPKITADHRFTRRPLAHACGRVYPCNGHGRVERTSSDTAMSIMSRTAAVRWSSAPYKHAGHTHSTGIRMAAKINQSGSRMGRPSKSGHGFHRPFHGILRFGRSSAKNDFFYVCRGGKMENRAS